MKNKSHSLVGVIMGSKSDWKTMIHCCDTLKKFSVKHEVKIISAHRTPNRLHKFLNETKKNKIEVIIAGAGGAAHLAGVAASITTLPVLGVPIESKLKGLDSLLSTKNAEDDDDVVYAKAQAVDDVNSKLTAVEKIVMPLLVNLLKTADKEYIYWPNREKAVKETADKILQITRG